jgi:adenylate kinase family enzyme
MSVGRRIIVTGLAGAGKSTFSKALSTKTGIPLIHLDLEFWKPGWVEPSLDEWREKQHSLLAGDEWIADGNYHETLDLRLERADTVVFLDPQWRLCSWRSFLRGRRRTPDFRAPAGCDDSRWRQLRAEWWLVGRIWRNRRSDRERELAIVAEHGRHADLQVLRSKSATREFLERLDSA